MEAFHGLAILSSNSRSILDETIVARIHSLVRFRLPDPDQRRAIWLRLLPEGDQSREMAESLAGYELSGENIRNVIQFAAIQAIAEGRDEIVAKDALTGVRREMEKAGRKF
jgi:AAA+ superfamily predicted ATPase